MGATVTEATGTGATAVTVRGAAPIFPPLEASICVEPAASAVTVPESDDVAALMLVDAQTTVRPDNTLLLESRSVAVAWVVWPTVSELAGRSTLIEATGAGTVEGVTVSEAAPLFNPRVALMETTPGALALTSPEPETVAIEESPLLQTTASVSGLL